MDGGPRGQPELGPTGGCLGYEVMDRIVSDPGFEPGPDVEAHLDSCEQCRDRLTKVRRANQFLERFRTDITADVADVPALAGPEASLVQIQGYQVLGLLSYGGQGAVYRAVQKRTSREVAIKVPIGDAQRRPSARYRFEREIELTARLDHPGIVRVLGACELNDGRLGCVMEFVHGEPFDRWASRERGRGSIRGIVAAAEAVADAIAYAHQRAIIHRDIKPSNVLVTENGTPRVLDFGLAKAIDDSGSSFATLTGAFLGTLLFSAPEQVSKGASRIDLRTDVYTLGLLLFQALTGRLPYDAEASAGELIHRILNFPTTRPSSFAPEVGSEIDAVVMKAMAREPERRYQSVAEFRDDLRAWLDGRAVLARNDSRLYILRKAAWQHRRIVMLAGTVIVALITVLTAGLITREQIARADLAGAVRDARLLESYWVRVAELRSIGRDNFEAGEFGAWDALLEPEPTLVENGIEDSVGEIGTPRSAAYWALWEIYLNTPVVFSVPNLDRTLAAYDPALDAIAKISSGPNALQWWDWKSGIVTRSMPIRADSQAMIFRFAPDARTAVLTYADGGSFLLDTNTETLIQSDPHAVSKGAVITNDRVLSTVLAENDEFELRLWDQAPREPTLIARIPIEKPESVAIDASGSTAVALAINGDLTALDMRTGAVVLERSGDAQPRIHKVHSRGNPGEFLLLGLDSSVYTLDIDDGCQQIVPLGAEGAFPDGLRELTSAGDRFVAVTDRHRLEIGSSARLTSKPVFPALNAGGISLSADGGHAFGQALPSGRSVAIELEGSVVRRLPFPAEVTESGFATVTSVLFSDDSTTLLASSMDGSARGFDTLSGTEIWRTQHDLGNGVETMCTVGDSVYVGTHDLGLANAAVLRFRDGTVEQLHTAEERRFSGLEADPDGRICGLTGAGHVILIDADDGALIRETFLQRHPEIPTFRALVRLKRHALLVAGPAELGAVLLDENTLERVGEAIAMPPIRDIAACPTDPDLFATAGDDGRVRLWRLRAGSSPTAELVREMGTHAGPIFCIAFSPDGRRLAASGEVHPDHPEQGGQLFLIDLQAPDRCIAGNLEYHIARFVDQHGREPGRARALRGWAGSVH